MKYTNTYLDIFNIVLSVIIIGFIIFGTNKKCLERFENIDDKLPNLSEYQKEILEGVQRGIIDNPTISKIIKEGKFKKEDLDNIIRYLAHSDNITKTAST
jgi:hypothetical protein